ncbi:hypothetical protein M422DRAFT_256760 [Sphaerobolus stellatus SS14]|uniref:BD-FAE-like domain-containing protein n=1 Tax=Sphaerobolus stellatus (strain SS14) TaxID=990650 RepID=A0A0C9VFK3_SPHS4|nr:hypothetical protein M422DRAFT_256760 [Sphaerobolus stellatus SS14]
MDAVAQIQETNVYKVLGPTREAFKPLLTAKLPIIRKTPKKTFQYGPTERHQLDIYYPPEGTTDAPILFFIYGGGFIMGSRQIIPGLMYDNVGAFFAQRGILTVIADYRLAPAFKYPEPVEDVRDAIKFVLTSPEVDIDAQGTNRTKIFVAGNSAGGAHATTLFLNKGILGSADRSAFRGVIFVSAAFGSAPSLVSYYGTEEDLIKNSPLGLLQSHLGELKQLLPPRVLLMTSEKDPEVFAKWADEVKKYVADDGLYLDSYLMRGHNHISTNSALSSGEGEEWGKEVVKWIKA